MSFFHSMLSRLRGDDGDSQPAPAYQAAPQLVARLAQEPPTRFVTGTPNTWSEPLRSLVPALDVAGLIDLYQSLGLSGRYHLVEELGQWSEVFDLSTAEGMLNYQTWMDRLENPVGPYEKLFRGAMHQAAGWMTRGNAPIVSVTDERVDAFQAHLHAALDFLVESGNEFEGADIVAFLHAQGCAYALPGEALMEVAGLWRSIDPFNRHGLYTLGLQLDERWFGDGERQLGFAETIAQNAPAGHDGLVVAAEIVEQRFNYLWHFEELDIDDCRARSMGLPRVQAFLMLAYEKLFNSGAATLTPTLEARHLNYFAWCFYRGGNIPMAYEAIRRMRGQIISGLWDQEYDDWDSVDSFEWIRNDVISRVEFA